MIDLYTITYNEEFIAPFVLKYYDLLPIRKIVVYDNQSTDNTVKILKQHKKVEIREFDTNNTFDDVKHQILKNQIWKESKGAVDWVCVSDFDEVLYCENIQQYLDLLKSQNIDILDTPGIEFICEKISTNYDILLHKQKYMKFNFYEKAHLNRKKLLFNPNTIKDINFTAGQHFLFPKKYDNSPIKYGLCNSIYMFHLKFLTLKYILNRHHMYVKRFSENNKKYKLGIHYTVEDEQQKKDFLNRLKTSSTFEECCKQSHISND